MKNDKENLLAFPRFLNNLFASFEWASSREIENAERGEGRDQFCQFKVFPSRPGGELILNSTNDFPNDGANDSRISGAALFANELKAATRYRLGQERWRRR